MPSGPCSFYYLLRPRGCGCVSVGVGDEVTKAQDGKFTQRSE